MSKTQIVTGGIADDAVSEEHLDATAITGTTALAETPASTDELLISDGGTLKRIDFSHIYNTPSFGVKLSSNQALTDGTLTKITWDSELWDTDSAFASNKFTVPSGKAGKYYFTTMGYTDGQDDGEHFFLAFYKNGSRIFREVGWTAPSTNTGMRAMASVTLDLSAGDYIEVYGYQNEGSNRDISSDYAQFSGHKLVGVEYR